MSLQEHLLYILLLSILQEEVKIIDLMERAINYTVSWVARMNMK